MLSLIMRTLRLMDRRNEERFLALYTTANLGHRTSYETANAHAKRISNSINTRFPFPKDD